MGDTFGGSSVVKPLPKQPAEEQPSCSIAAFTNPSVLKVLRQLAENANISNQTSITSMQRSHSEERDTDGSTSSTRMSGSCVHRYLSVTFSPVESQSVAEKVSFTFDDALADPPSPLLPRNANKPEKEDQVSEIEAQISQELQALPPNERQMIEKEVKGQSLHEIMTQQSPLNIIEMELFDQELRKLLHIHPVYQELIPSLENDYVKDLELRSKMLMAENYDCERAAFRLAQYLKLLHEMFGPYLLARPIQLVDLTAEERQLQRRGLQQLFKFRDHVGRRIVGCFDSHYPPTTNMQSQVS